MADDESKPRGKWITRLPVDEVLAWTNTLSPGSFRVLIALESFCRSESRCWPSNATLASTTGIKGQRSIRRCLAELESTRWIERRAGGRSDRMGIVLLRRLDPDLPVEGGGPNGPGGEAQTDRGGGGPNGPGGEAQTDRQNKDAVLNKDALGNQDAFETRKTFRSRKHRSSTTDVRSAGKSAVGRKSKKTAVNQIRGRAMDPAIRQEAASQKTSRTTAPANDSLAAEEPF